MNTHWQLVRNASFVNILRHREALENMYESEEVEYTSPRTRTSAKEMKAENVRKRIKLGKSIAGFQH